MITLPLKQNQTLRLLLLLAIACMLTLILLFGSQLLPLPGSQPFPFAHAATTCASSNGTQQTVCEQQDPIAQGCAQDARSIEMESVYTAQNTLIGEVDLRYSARCHTYWVRTIAYANARQIQAIDATIVFHTGQRADRKKTIPSNGQQAITFTPMVFVQPGTFILNWSGTFSLTGKRPPITIPL